MSFYILLSVVRGFTVSSRATSSVLLLDPLQQFFTSMLTFKALDVDMLGPTMKVAHGLYHTTVDTSIEWPMIYKHCIP